MFISSLHVIKPIGQLAHQKLGFCAPGESGLITGLDSLEIIFQRLLLQLQTHQTHTYTERLPGNRASIHNIYTVALVKKVSQSYPKPFLKNQEMYNVMLGMGKNDKEFCPTLRAYSTKSAQGDLHNQITKLKN